MAPVVPAGGHLGFKTIFGVGSGDNDGGDLGSWSSLIGIITAIVGNILIALALNVQRYSHIKLHRQRREASIRAKEALKRAQNGARNGDYGTTLSSGERGNPSSALDNDTRHDDPLSDSYNSGNSRWTEDSDDANKVADTYLKSPSWWLGQILMTVGEMGNFLAYGFAPASIVSPLGVVALISNCIIAPIFFGEHFRKRDFWGVVIAVGGAVTVVLSAKQEETKLNPHDVWDAITTTAFEVYLGVTIGLIALLIWASPRYGNRTILIDLGLVGLFGGYTALTTKGVSSMLSSTLLRAFTTPVFYVLVVILLGTAVLQVRYLNKALQRFDSTQVIPIQFVLFTLSVIIGSAILYRDFERTNSEQAMKFVGGCLLTFFGVFLITSGRPRQDEEDDLSDAEGIEDTIRLTEQDGAVQSTSAKHEEPQAIGSSPSSRRSSRVSFADAPNLRPLTLQRDSGVPSNRRPEGSTSRTTILSENVPLLGNPWRHSTEDLTSPTPQELPSAFSEDSFFTNNSALSTGAAVTPTESAPIQSTLSLPQLTTPILNTPIPASASNRPTTPRPSFSSIRSHSHPYGSTIFSPSPLSSTVTAVVADSLLRGDESPISRKKSSRRMRPSLRSSLFMPNDPDEEGSEPHEGQALLSSASEQVLPTERSEHEQTGESEHRGLRGRARSLSNTLGGFFGGKRRRRNTDTENRLVDGRQSNGESTDSVNHHSQ